MKRYFTGLLSFFFFLTFVLHSSGCSKSKEEIDALEKRVFDQIYKINNNLENPSGSVYVAFRKDGNKQEEMWSYKSSWQEGLKSSVKLLLQKRIYPDSIEICIPYNSKKTDFRTLSLQNLNVHRGIQGLQFEFNGKKESVCPTQMIANNQSFKEVVDEYVINNKISKNIIKNLKFEKFEAKQLLLSLDKNGDKKRDYIKEMYRGNTLVTQSDVTKENVRILAENMATWLLKNLNDNGRLIYEYFPSAEKESTSNNMIRQFMGTAAIGRWAEFIGSDEIYEKQEKNLEYNFDRFYEEEDGLGYIKYRNKIKLGAASLAALAIAESKNRTDFSSFEKKLRTFTFQMWNENGSMNTFYKSNRNDNQNFYPGEALLYWSLIYTEAQDPEILRKFMKSFRYYRNWHLNNRNPAFIPWHTQAYYNIWLKTGNEDLKEFIFLMNDWLIEKMQKNEVNTYKDTEGRFYNSQNRFGPPHASSTGVYLEGLIDAYKLAKATGDTQRKDEYRKSIVKGIRSVMQLQFADEIDTYYINKKDKVLGGIRTTVYDNKIRVDNVQHNLMGIIKILKEFQNEDFTL